MALEAISSITEAEEKARAAKAEAALVCKRLVSEAEEAGRLAIEDARLKAEQEIRELKSKAFDKARMDALALARNIENRKATMLVKADSRAEKAIDLVIERVVNS